MPMSFLERLGSHLRSQRRIWSVERWKSTPRPTKIFFYAAVFCLFNSVGALFLAMNTIYFSPLEIFLNIVLWGGTAVICIAVLLSKRYWFIPVLGIFIVLFAVVDAHSLKGSQLIAAGSPLHRQLKVLGIIGIASVYAGYALFIAFITRQGARYFRAQNEIAMAAEIHQALVPPIHRTIRSFEIYGVSVPSGEVGGDLVDVAGDDDESWTGYVADVSGHGVSAGLLMAMFKTAVRTRVKNTSATELLAAVHRALYPMKTPNMFATVGVLQWTGRNLSLSLAGHLPLLHYVQSCREVREYAALDLPWGVLAEQTFQSREVVCQAGDIFVLLTDGLTEVFDGRGTELGIAPLKEVLGRSASQKLPELFNNMRAASLNFGKQHDDQTMLIVRCL